MSTPRAPRQPRPGKLGAGFLDGIDAPKPKPKREHTAAADPASEQGSAGQRGSALPAPADDPARGKTAAPAQPTPDQAPVAPHAPAPAEGTQTGSTSKTSAAKIRRTAFLPPELIARVKLATATHGGTYTFVTLQAVGQLYEQGRLTEVVTEYVARSQVSSTAGSSLFPDLTTRAPARPKAQFPLHMTPGQLSTVDALKDELGVDRSLFIEAVLDATMPH